MEEQVGLARAGAELDGVSWTPRVPSTIVPTCSSPHRDLILLTAPQILTCFVSSCAPASVVFSGAVSPVSIPQTVPVLQTYRQSNPVLVRCVYRILLTLAPCAFLFLFWFCLSVPGLGHCGGVVPQGLSSLLQL